MTNKNFDNNDPCFRPEAAVGTEETPGTPGASESRENKNLLSPRGRIGRRTFAKVWLGTGFANYLLMELGGYGGTPTEFLLTFAVSIFLAVLAVFGTVKRCRDAGIETAWVILALVPIINIGLFFYLVWRPAKDAGRAAKPQTHETRPDDYFAQETDHLLEVLRTPDENGEVALNDEIEAAIRKTEDDARTVCTAWDKGEREARWVRETVGKIRAVLRSLLPKGLAGIDGSFALSAVLFVYSFFFLLVGGFALDWLFEISWGVWLSFFLGLTGLIWWIPFGAILMAVLVCWYLAEVRDWWWICAIAFSFPTLTLVAVEGLGVTASDALNNWPKVRAAFALKWREWFGRR